METQKLQQDIGYTGTVLLVEKNYDSYAKKADKNTTMYCHKIIMDVDGEQFTCQQCTESADQVDFFARQQVKFGVINFSKGVYTIKRLASFGESASFDITGTVADRSLSAAVSLYAYRPDTEPAKVLAAADLFKEWFTRNL